MVTTFNYINNCSYAMMVNIPKVSLEIDQFESPVCSVCLIWWCCLSDIVKVLLRSPLMRIICLH